MPTISENLLNSIKAIGIHNVDAAAKYPYRKAWAEAQWKSLTERRAGAELLRAFRQSLTEKSRIKPQKWQGTGAVQLISRSGRSAVIQAENATIEITFLASDLVRVRAYQPGKEHPPVPYAIAKPEEDWTDLPPLEFTQTESALLMTTDNLSLGVSLDDATIFFANANGDLMRVDVDMAWGTDGVVRHRTSMVAEEHIFGLGERATPWNRRGRTHILWNTDPAGYTDNDEPINMNIPTYVGVHNAGSYLVFYENTYYAEFDMGESLPNIAEHRFAGGELRYYIAIGSTKTLIERYTELTGRHDLQPLWMLGYQQSRWSYYPEERVRKLAQDFREHDVPCDVIHLDIDYMEGFRNFTWNKERFPDLARLAADLREQGIKLIAIIDAGVKKDPDYETYRTGMQGDLFCKQPDGKTFHAPVWPGMCAFPDFTDSRTRRWWGANYRSLLEAGIAGFWNDMNEPAVFSSQTGQTLPDTIYHDMEGQGGDHREAHNIYGMQMVRATREGLLKLQPDQRPVVMTRAGWAGVQRHSTSWTADNESTWNSLRLTIPLVTALGLSGVSFTGSDIGGFTKEADGELFTRWLQMGVFMPFFRAHTVINTPDQEPWAYGEPYLSIARRFIQLRYELLPYLYTAVWQMTEKGWPMVRPLWWGAEEDHPTTNLAQLWDIDDEFLCGDSLLVAPIGYPDTTTRDVTLPPGTWYDFWSNRIRQGGETFEQFASLETIPLFVRAGTVLTMGDYGPSVEQRKQKFLRLGVYPLTEPGESTSVLYEDKGTGFDYREGDYRINHFHMQCDEEQLVVDWESEGDYAPPYEHIELTLHGLKRVPKKILVDGKEYRILTADPVRHTTLTGIPIFKKLEITL